MSTETDAQNALAASVSAAASATSAAESLAEAVDTFEARAEEAAAAAGVIATQARDTANASASSAAASASSAASSAELAEDISNISTSDDVITAIDANKASTFRVQQDARHHVINLLDEGVVANSNGTAANGTDDTAAFTAAVAKAVATKRKLWLPPSSTGMRLTATVNARYADLELESPVFIDHTTGPGIIVGDSSSLTSNRNITWHRVKNTTTSPTNPSVRVVGFKKGNIYAGICDYLEFFCDANVVADTSNAYASVWCDGGKIDRLDFFGQNGVAWNNDMKFFGGRFVAVNFLGSYSHNGNKFYGPTIENGVVTFAVGHSNVFRDVRGEGTATCSFASGTFGNEIHDNYTGATGGLMPGVVVTSDLGIENFVTSTRQELMQPVELVRIDNRSTIFDGSAEFPFGFSTPVPGITSLRVRTANQPLYDSGIIALDQTPEATSGILPEQQSRMGRLSLSSSHKIWRPRVYCYDANKVLLDPGSAQLIDPVGGWAATASTYYGFGATVSAARIVVTSPTVKFLRVVVQSSSAANTPFDYVALTGYMPTPHTASATERWKRATRRPLYQATAPTQGLAHLGETIGHATGRFTCVSRVDTTLSVSALATDTTITVASATGMASGDLIGVLLDDGKTHWTTINGAPAGSVVTLTVAMPSAAASGLQVSTNRWVSVT